MIKITEKDIQRVVKMTIDNVLNEGLIKTYSTDETIRVILKTFNDDEKKNLSINKEDDKVGGYYFDFYISKNAEDFQKLIYKVGQVMNTCGYTESLKNENENLIWLRYQMKFNKLVNVKQWHYIYHATSKRHLEKIMKYGLSPRSNNSCFSYPPRVYFVYGTDNTTILQSVKNTLRNVENSRENLSNRIKNENEYVVLRIDTSKLNDNIRFYQDQDYKLGIFTYENIPPSCIEITDI